MKSTKTCEIGYNELWIQRTTFFIPLEGFDVSVVRCISNVETIFHLDQRSMVRLQAFSSFFWHLVHDWSKGAVTAVIVQIFAKSVFSASAEINAKDDGGNGREYAYLAFSCHLLIKQARGPWAVISESMLASYFHFCHYHDRLRHRKIKNYPQLDN